MGLLLSCVPLRDSGGEGDDNGGGGGGMDPPGMLTISPQLVEIDLNDGADKTVALRATSKVRGDVTQQASWSLSDASVGSIVAGKLTVRGSLESGGVYQAYAAYRNENGSAQVNIKVRLTDVIDNTAPADAKDWFGGATGGTAPQILYPFDDTMMAPNVLQVVLQWRSTGQQVFRIDAAGPTYQRSFYVGAGRCPGGQCKYPVDDKVWSGMGHSSLGQAVTLTVYGVQQKDGQVGVSMPSTVRFSPEDIRGGLYYFSPTIRGVKRVPLGASRPVDFITNGDETGCAGCHAVSRDGKRVAVEFGSGQTRTGSTVVDGAMPRSRNFPLNAGIAWNFAWFNPTGDKLLTNWSGDLTIRDPANGQVLQSISRAQYDSTYGASMPEWSPDGKWLAFVRLLAQENYDFEVVDSGDIVIMPYNNGALGPATTLVKGTPRSEVHIWPSWTPDSKWLVFNSHECGGGSCNSYNAAQTRVRLIRAVTDAGDPAVGSQPIDLEAGTHQKHQTNNWPKVAPFLQAGRFVFVVYSASYGYGFDTGGRPQLFMFGLDLSKATGAADPSFQPIWLPFQEPATGNHSAIWTTDVVCVKDGDCPGEFQCTMGMCVPRLG